MLLYAGYRSGMLEILVKLRDDNIMIILRPRDHKHRPSGECESVGTIPVVSPHQGRFVLLMSKTILCARHHVLHYAYRRWLLVPAPEDERGGTFSYG